MMDNGLEVIYTVIDKERAYTNVLFYLPFIIAFIIGFCVETNSIINIVKINTIKLSIKQMLFHCFKMIVILIIITVIGSSVMNTFLSLDRYKKYLLNGDHLVAEGYVDTFERYISGTGNPDGCEFRFTLKNLEFDTGYSYGNENQFDDQQSELIQTSCLIVKYVTEGEKNIILELCAKTT